MAGRHKAPSRGAIAGADGSHCCTLLPHSKARELTDILPGIKEDMKRAATGDYNPAPAGVGTAWSHNFLNQSAVPALLGLWSRSGNS